MSKISEDWLKSVGFKWHQFDRQPNKQWCLWLGGCLECPTPGSDKQQRWRMSDDEDFAIELAVSGLPCDPGRAPDECFWFCWFRSDTAGRYHRFIHVRHLRYQDEVINLVSALTGRPWNPANHFYGSAKCDRCAESARKDIERIDRKVMMERAKWASVEEDDSRGRALPEHMAAAVNSGMAK